jgi:surfactin synthase thioesterase subunit
MTHVNPNTKVRLFCLPYAGGSSAAYHPWKGALGGIELRPVELAGRGRRIADDMYRNAEEAVADVLKMIRAELYSGPYMLFGHSMGAMIAYELAHKIREEGLPAPRHIFFSGKGAVHIQRPDKTKYHLLSEDDFKSEVIQLGGTPPEFFEHKELMELLLPLLKNDFKIAETYHMKGEIIPLDYDISVLLGDKDDFNAQQREEWALHTTKTCHFYHFPGGHFFINDEQKAILDIISKVRQALSASYA